MYKVIWSLSNHVATQGGCDMFVYVEGSLEIVEKSDPRSPVFSGTLKECEKWYWDNWELFCD